MVCRRRLPQAVPVSARIFGTRTDGDRSDQAIAAAKAGPGRPDALRANRKRNIGPRQYASAARECRACVGEQRNANETSATRAGARGRYAFSNGMPPSNHGNQPVCGKFWSRKRPMAVNVPSFDWKLSRYPAPNRGQQITALSVNRPAQASAVLHLRGTSATGGIFQGAYNSAPGPSGNVDAKLHSRTWNSKQREFIRFNSLCIRPINASWYRISTQYA